MFAQQLEDIHWRLAELKARTLIEPPIVATGSSLNWHRLEEPTGGWGVSCTSRMRNQQRHEWRWKQNVNATKNYLIRTGWLLGD